MAVIDRIREKMRSSEYECAVPHFFEEMVNDDLIFADTKRPSLMEELRAASRLIRAERDLRLLDRQAMNAKLQSYVASRRPDGFS